MTLDKIPAGWKWMYYVSLYAQPLHAVNVNELAGLTADCDKPFTYRPDGSPVCRFADGNDVLRLYAMELSDPGDDSVKWDWYGYSFFYLAFYSVAASIIITNLDLRCGGATSHAASGGQRAVPAVSTPQTHRLCHTAVGRPQPRLACGAIPGRGAAGGGHVGHAGRGEG